MSGNDLLASSTQRLMRERCTTSVVRQSENGEWPADLWEAVSDAGLPWISVPEQYGGSGGTLAEAMLVIRLAASAAAPIPVAETGVLGGWLLASAGVSVTDGSVSVAPGHAADDVELLRRGPDWTIRGEVHRVPYGRHVERVALLAAHEGVHHVVSLDRTRCEVDHHTNVAGEPRDTIRFDLALGADEIAPAADGVGPAELKLRGALVRSVQIGGALEAIRDLTLEYSTERRQFGQAISRFQAVQQLLVELAEQTSMARAASDVAITRLGQPGSDHDVMIAKIISDHAATVGASRAHQVHGAIGVTKEHDLQLLTRRVWSWRSEFGNGTYWSRILGQHVLDAGADHLWPAIAR